MKHCIRMPSPGQLPGIGPPNSESLITPPTPEAIGKCIKVNPEVQWYPAGPYYDVEEFDPHMNPLIEPDWSDVEHMLKVQLGDHEKIDPASALTVCNAYPVVKAFVYYASAANDKHLGYNMRLQSGNRDHWERRFCRFNADCATAMKQALMAPFDSLSSTQIDFIRKEQLLSQWAFQSNKDALARTIERNRRYLRTSFSQQVENAKQITNATDRQQKYKQIIDDALANHLDLRVPCRCLGWKEELEATFRSVQLEFRESLNMCWERIRADAKLEPLKTEPIQNEE